MTAAWEAVTGRRLSSLGEALDGIANLEDAEGDSCAGSGRTVAGAAVDGGRCVWGRLAHASDAAKRTADRTHNHCERRVHDDSEDHIVVDHDYRLDDGSDGCRAGGHDVARR